jgi:hypothetical protein
MRLRTIGLCLAALGTCVLGSSAIAQTTHATGSVSLPINAHFDLDTGAESDRAGADFRYVRGSTQASGLFLWPVNGAALQPISGNRDFHNTCSVELDGMISTRLALSEIPDGQYICARTSDGRVGVLRINEPPLQTANTLDFGFTVWADISTQPPTGTATQGSGPTTPRGSNPVPGAGTPTGHPVPTSGSTPLPGGTSPTAQPNPSSPGGSGNPPFAGTPSAGLVDRTEVLACPTTNEVDNALGLTRGVTADGSEFEIEYPNSCGNPGFCSGAFVMFEGARIEGDKLVCEYTNFIRVLVDHDVFINANDRSWLLRFHGAEMAISRATGGQCVAENGFGSDGVCRGTGLDPRYCPQDEYQYFTNGDCVEFYENPQTCQARCDTPPSIELGQN